MGMSGDCNSYGVGDDADGIGLSGSSK